MWRWIIPSPGCRPRRRCRPVPGSSEHCVLPLAEMRRGAVAGDHSKAVAVQVNGVMTRRIVVQRENIRATELEVQKRLLDVPGSADAIHGRDATARHHRHRSAAHRPSSRTAAPPPAFRNDRRVVSPWTMPATCRGRNPREPPPRSEEAVNSNPQGCRRRVDVAYRWPDALVGDDARTCLSSG